MEEPEFHAAPELLGCDDIDILLLRLSELGVHPHVSGWDAQRSVEVSDYQLPIELRARAGEIVERASGWVGKR